MALTILRGISEREKRNFIYILKNKKKKGVDSGGECLGGDGGGGQMLSRQKKAVPGRREELPSTGNLA